jgi:hypothetical protein
MEKAGSNGMGEAQVWLNQKRKHAMFSSAGYALATILGGCVFLSAIFWLAYGVSHLVLLNAIPLSFWNVAGSVIIAVVVCGLLFADAVYAERDDMSFLPLWFLREYIDIGPRLILDGYPHLARVRRLMHLDVENCAAVLMFLARREAPTSRFELQKVFPELDWEWLRLELQLIPGVIFFQRDSNRVTLTLPLRLELRAFRKQSKRVRIPTPEPEPEPVPVNEPQRLSPSEILGVVATATVAEIKTAYRNRIKECHPDRFSNMDEQSRELAEEWTKSLNAAYATLLAEAQARR